ncbi:MULTISPECIES: sigma-70 family RNA polymerase sigma factor [unclassified Streptomyces]|uniref:sigma-70 family RNA polymerase sigma factor n=1 Tax=unclassified Streptomyces TaxID=2593676 RepID=UPI00380EB21B
MTPELVTALRPLLAAEAHAEAAATGTDPGDLEQTVWLRLVEHLDAAGLPRDPPRWLRDTAHTEARRTRHTTLIERPYATEPVADPADGPERLALAADHRAAVRETVRLLPARCARLLGALLSPADLTYRQIAGELGISQGAVGPERSRCLGCLRRMLTPEVAARLARG